MSGYAIVELAPGEAGGFSPRGGPLALWRAREHEVMLSGPAETGKTFVACYKLHALLWKYPGARAVMVRKVMSSLYPTCFQTYLKVIGDDSGVAFYGGKKPEWADYPNGSRLYFAGLDNPGKALSSERDFIYVNQAEDLLLGDWETLTTRCTGRGSVAPYTQMFGDCNPGAPSHWIKRRLSLRLIESRHEDNPSLFDDAGEITEQGKRSLAVLDALTGVRKERLRFGRWVGAEGIIYEGWDAAIHHIEPFPIPAGWNRYRSIDFGYTNPFVCQWWAEDPDGRIYLYREIYRSNRTVAKHCEQIGELEAWKKLNDEGQPVRNPAAEKIAASVSDHDAEDRATLAENGIGTVGAVKDVKTGIERVQARLAKAGDGKPRLFIMKGCTVGRDELVEMAGKPTSTAAEIESYVWAPEQPGRAPKEEPLKINDHGVDAMRYMVMHLDGPAPTTIAGAESVAPDRPTSGTNRWESLGGRSERRFGR